MKVNLIKINGGLFPSLPDDELQIAKIKRGEVVQYDLKKPRNGKFHRKYFALLGIVCDNTDYSVEQFLHIIKIKIGHYEMVVTPQGRSLYMPKSISFAKMDNDNFERFYQKTIQIILSDFLLGVTERELQAQVDQVMGFV